MTEKRFERYLLDGGFSFGDEQIPPRWCIHDKEEKNSPFTFLEFNDEYKDLCDEIVEALNNYHERIFELSDSLMNQVMKNGELFEEVNQLRIENMRLKELLK